MLSPRAECSSPASSTSMSAICAPWATAPNPSAVRCRRWRCSATSSGTTRRRWRAPAPRWSASPTLAGARVSSPSAPRHGASSGSIERVPRRLLATQMHSRSTKTSSFRWRDSATTPTRSSVSTSSAHSRTSSSWRASSRCCCRNPRRLPAPARMTRPIPISARARSCWPRSSLPRSRCSRSVRERWQWLSEQLDLDLAAALPQLERLGYARLSSELSTRDARSGTQRLVDLLQDRTLRVSWKRELREPLEQIFSGRVFAPLLAACDDTHRRVLRSRVFVALHMHAGDGNVHTNIPVNSDDYEMLQAATAAVKRIMAIARGLGGAISGEHGIGITKLEFLQEDEARAFRAYKQRVDPEGHFNRGKLLPGADLSGAYTPSFNLLGHESLIMQQSDLASISDAVKDCLRCGKCKPVCATHVPRANLLYSPRDKILATSLLIEAFLYEEQTRRGISVQHWDEFADVSDHCTLCHKCAAPCPVDIDFGDVSMAMRDLLRRTGKKALQSRHRGGAVLSECDQSADHPSGAQRADWLGLQAAACRSSAAEAAWRARRREHPPATTGKAAAARAGDSFRQQEDAGRPAEAHRARAAGYRESAVRADHSRSGSSRSADSEAVFYFPGLRVRAPVLAGGSGDAGDAVARRRADRAAAGLPVLRLSAARRGSRPIGHRRSRPTTECCSTASPIHSTTSTSHRRRQLRHLLRSTAGLRVRSDLSRLPHHRYPRVPDGEGYTARGRYRRALHVPRPVPLADEELRCAQGRQHA